MTCFLICLSSSGQVPADHTYEKWSVSEYENRTMTQSDTIEELVSDEIYVKKIGDYISMFSFDDKQLTVSHEAKIVTLMPKVSEVPESKTYKLKKREVLQDSVFENWENFLGIDSVKNKQVTLDSLTKIVSYQYGENYISEKYDLVTLQLIEYREGHFEISNEGKIIYKNKVSKLESQKVSAIWIFQNCDPSIYINSSNQTMNPALFDEGYRFINMY
jgi:hypothetical protein